MDPLGASTIIERRPIAESKTPSRPSRVALPQATSLPATRPVPSRDAAPPTPAKDIYSPLGAQSASASSIPNVPGWSPVRFDSALQSQQAAVPTPSPTNQWSSNSSPSRPTQPGAFEPRSPIVQTGPIGQHHHQEGQNNASAHARMARQYQSEYSPVRPTSFHHQQQQSESTYNQQQQQQRREVEEIPHPGKEAASRLEALRERDRTEGYVKLRVIGLERNKKDLWIKMEAQVSSKIHLEFRAHSVVDCADRPIYRLITPHMSSPSPGHMANSLLCISLSPQITPNSSFPLYPSQKLHLLQQMKKNVCSKLLFRGGLKGSWRLLI